MTNITVTESGSNIKHAQWVISYIQPYIFLIINIYNAKYKKQESPAVADKPDNTGLPSFV